jgi:hypothetical protein
MIKRADVMDELVNNGANAFEYGSKTTPFVSDIKNVAHGIV